MVHIYKNGKLKTHRLKTDPETFADLLSGVKKFEVRKDDRGYGVGDTLFLQETKYSAAQMAENKRLEFTGRTVTRYVSYILRGPIYGIEESYVVMGFL